MELRLKKIPFLIFTIFESLGCPDALINSGQAPELILKNGKILADNLKNPAGAPTWNQALSVLNGNIYSVGINFLVEKEKNETTKIIDLAGKVVLPAFIDCDQDFLKGGLSLSINKIITPSDADLKKAFYTAQDYAIQNGITSIQTRVSAENFEKFLVLLQEAFQNQELKIRFSLYAPLENFEELKNSAKKFNPNQSEWIDFGGFFTVLDDDLVSKKAMLLEPYADAPALQPAVNFTQAQLQENLLKANKADFTVSFIAHGDKAVGIALNSIVQVRRRLFNSRIRNRIIGFELVKPTILDQMRNNLVVPILHPTVPLTFQNTLLSRVGKERTKNLYLAQTLENQKISFSIGSRWPDFTLNPFAGIFSLITRFTENNKPTKGWNFSEKIKIEKAVTAFSLGGAYSQHSEHFKGSIREGKEADLIVLSADPFKVNPIEVLKISVLMTIVNGKIVYNKLN